MREVSLAGPRPRCQAAWFGMAWSLVTSLQHFSQGPWRPWAGWAQQPRASALVGRLTRARECASHKLSAWNRF